MPQGPGDDILDAIESGAKDDQIMSKYKIDADQLKAFKGLHYGLSNQKMSYNEINDYFPDLKNYFKPGAPPAQPGKATVDVIEKPDFTKPVRQKQVVESTASPAVLKSYKQEAESGKAGLSLQEKLDDQLKTAHQNIYNELAGNDDVTEKLIRENRYDQAKRQDLNQLADKPRTDMPIVHALAEARNRVLPQDTKPQDLPVTQEDITQAKSDIQNNEPQARQFLNQLVLRKPDKAKDIQASTYLMDAMERMKEKPEIGLKVNDNLNKLKAGDLKYNAATGQLIKEEGFFPSIVSGIKERTKEVTDYDLFQAPDDKIIKLLEQRRSDRDPDEPVNNPTGAGEIGQMTGMEWQSLLKGAATGLATGAFGAEGAAPYLTAAINAPEYYKRSYATALEQSYNQLRAQGKSTQEALKTAQEQARYEGKAGAAEGAIMSAVGSKIGLRDFPEYNITGGFKNAVKNVLSETGHYAAETSIEGLANGLVSAKLQDMKNMHAEQEGIFRPTAEGLKDKVTGTLAFSLAMGAMTKTVKGLIDPELRQKILYHMGRQPEETINTEIGNAVLDGHISPDDAKNIHQEVMDQKKVDETVPDNIKDVSRMAIMRKIDRRNELEKKLETTDKAFHPPIKEEIKKLNDEILEHSSHIKTNEDESKTETEAKADQADGVLKKETEPVADKTGVAQSAPVSEKIEPSADYRTLNMGTEEGKEETKEARALTKERMLEGNTPMDGEGGKGETGRQFASRVLSPWEELKYNAEKNTTLVTHSSVLKAIKAWEDQGTWKDVEKPDDPANMNNEQWKAFASAFNKESTDNGDVETLKGEDGDIHVVRHGQTEDNAANKFRSGNTNLTEQGIKQGEESGKILKEKTGGDIPKIISSDLPRAVHTSNIIHEQLKPTENAVQEQSATGVHVPASSGDSAPLGEGNESKGGVNKKTSETQEVSSAQKEFYETTIGAAPTTHHLVNVDPIVGGTPKKLREIIGDVSKGLKQRLIYAKTPGARANYWPSFKGIKIRYNGDLNATAHELGHSIDDHFNFYTEAAKDKSILSELSQFSNQGLASKPKASHPNPVKYIMQEGIAEWFRGFVINPTKAEQLAPKTTALYRSLVSDKFQKVIKQFSDDFRTWRGSSAKEITMANVEFEPDKPKGLLGQLFKKEETNNEFTISWAGRLAANMINPLHAFEKAFNYAKGIRGLSDVLPENDPIILSRILNGIDGKFGDILKNGMINGRGELLNAQGGVMLYDKTGRVIMSSGTTKNLEWLLKPLDNTDVGSLKNDMKDVLAYMISERAVELSKKFERGHLLTGTGGGVISDFSVAQKTLSDFHNGDPQKLARVQEAAARYREFADDILKYAVDKGRMSQEQYDLIKEDNTQYVALHRMMETEPGEELSVYQKATGKNLGAKSEITYTIKGSSKPIQNSYVNLLDGLYKTMRESDRNETLKAFRDMLVDPRDMNQGTPKRLSDIGIIAKQGDKETIPIFIDGKPEYWKFQKDIHEQLKGLDKEGYRLPGLITAPAKILRFATTRFPTFAARNWIKDLQDRIIKTTTGSGFKELVGNKEDWNAIARGGGLNSGQYLKSKDHYYGLLTEAMDVMAKNKKSIVADPVMLKHLWHKYEDLLYKGETSNRVAEYRSAFKEAQDKGMDNYNAMLYGAYKARDLIDFAIMGNWMKVANQIVPFSNAAVQGLRSGVVNFKQNPMGFAGRMLIYSIIPGAAAWLWNHRNDEDSKLYEEIPGYQRDMFWNFRIGPDKWLSIPKPYELSLPQAGIDRALSKVFAGNDKAFDGYGGDVAKLLLPFDEGNLAGPYQAVFEDIANHDFFRNRAIIPVDEDPLNLALRHTETASRLGQLLQKFSGWDARKWDYLIQRQFSYAGNFILKLSDIGVEKGRHEFDLSDTGLFKRSPAYNSQSVQEMIQFAKGNDLTKSPAYKKFNQKVGAYFNADDAKDREEKGKELSEYAKGLLTEWQKKNIQEHQEKRTEAKKEAQKKK